MRALGLGESIQEYLMEFCISKNLAKNLIKNYDFTFIGLGHINGVGRKRRLKVDVDKKVISLTDPSQRYSRAIYNLDDVEALLLIPKEARDAYIESVAIISSP